MGRGPVKLRLGGASLYDPSMSMTNQGKAPIDPDSLVGQVRVLISDDEAKNVAAGLGEYLWYSDAGIQALLRLWGENPKRTAIYILRLVAMTPAMQYKKWSSADLSVDGPAITAALNRVIDSIEKSLATDDATEIADFVAIVPTGAPVSQTALLPRHDILWDGEPVDPTLPLRML